MQQNSAKQIALCGLMASLAVVVMCLGGIIPVATYVCVAICMVLGSIVIKYCGRRFALTWYIAVSILGLLLGTDKEAAIVFVLLGYYPILKDWFEKCRFSILMKGLFFNIVILAGYAMMIYLLGMNEVLEDFSDAGWIFCFVLLLLGNATFFLLDRVMSRILRRG